MKVVPTKFCVICQQEKFIGNIIQHSECNGGIICNSCIEKTPVTLLTTCPICRRKTDEFKSNKKTKIHPLIVERNNNIEYFNTNNERELSPEEECFQIYKHCCLNAIIKTFNGLI